MTAADRGTRFRDLFALIALVGFAAESLCIHLLMWFRVSVMLVEPNGFILATKIGVTFVVVALGVSLIQRMLRSGGVRNVDGMKNKNEKKKKEGVA